MCACVHTQVCVYAFKGKGLSVIAHEKLTILRFLWKLPQKMIRKILLRREIMKKPCAYFRNKVEFRRVVQTFYGQRYFW